jgi:RNA polymerase sigma-70 factor (ECF subfamily)
MNAMDETTRAIWERVRSGDRAAYEELFARHADRALLYIRARLGPRLRSAVESRDVLQDAYLEAHRDFDSFQCTDEGAFARWFSRIIENRLRDLGDYLGAKKRQPVAPPPPAAITGPATAADRAERHQALLEGLDSLSEDHRTVILLRYFEGLGAEEAGQRMGRSAGAIRKLTVRALAELGGRL